MNCRRVMNMLSAYVDGELTGVEMLEIRRHLADCMDCSYEHEATLALKRAMSRLETVSPSPQFMARLMSSLEAVEITPYQRLHNALARFLHKRVNPVKAALAVSSFAMVVLSASSFITQPGVSDAPFASVTPSEAHFVNSALIPAPQIPSVPVNRRSVLLASDRTYSTNPTVELVSLSTTR